MFSWSPLFHWNRFSFLAAAISFPGKQNHCACPCSLFSPGWNSVSITWDFFRFWVPFGRAENPSPVSKTGLGFLARAWIPLHVIDNLILRGFVSEAGLKFQPGWPGWNSPCNQALRNSETLTRRTPSGPNARLISRATLSPSNFHKNPSNLYTLLICWKQGNSRKNKARVLDS